ncbi:haloacid dehalogenase superfamily, subfamily IA, variant 3 with third motif having DD or ED [Prauserella aidingensis]|uniref:HAD-IIIA family hydrolase n=1 Tax=Prauserella aidingensis TaxID=387890 RepID=UPI0020A5A7C8|nr:HAD-IIIA family hydrolase [Prauserella aidingensis]MCP2254141.1 haloacid dehalogenase superfamily, subfamily IA, variant 3 with third motif having DD or ED [Prauserella aidingensis]
MTGVRCTVVVPTGGRPSLGTTLTAVDAAEGAAPVEIVVVDDRGDPGSPLPIPELTTSVRVVRSGGGGPARARNIGWRLAETEWVAFLDDDVVPGHTWCGDLMDDLASLGPEVAGSQGNITVPLPGGRRPTDDERSTYALTEARWITADMAYRRSALAAVGGFDERFPRAYREDADLAVRMQHLGYRLVRGHRRTTHPPHRPAFLASVRRQAGNADDALLRAKYGPGWRELIGEGPGRRRTHAATTAAAVAAAVCGLARRRRSALASLAAWTWLTGRFAVERIRPGPRDPAELVRMLATSVLIPPVACAHAVAGWCRVRRERPRPAAVLFDRDDTLIEDGPYLSDPDGVRPVPGAGAVLDELRRRGIAVGVVSNQSGVARGLISPDQLAAVNATVERLLGPFDTWQVCPHGEDDGCACRKPRPELVHRAARAVGVPVHRCVVVGDTGADVDAGRAAGAVGALVPTARTREAERARTPLVAGDLASAVRLGLEALA